MPAAWTVTRTLARVLLRRGPLRVTIADAALAGVMLAIGLAELAITGPESGRSATAVALSAAGLAAGMLLRSSLVEISVVVVQLSLPIWLMTAEDSSWSLVQITAFLVSSYSVGAWRPLRRACLVHGTVVVAYLVVATVQGAGPIAGVASVGVATFAWVTGVFVRRRSEERDLALERARALEHERELRARTAIAEERTRLARDLHDALGHEVTVMVMHAGAVRRLLRPDQAEQRAALAEVERVGRRAVSELHRLVAALRDRDQLEVSSAGLAGVPDLVARARGAGAQVSVDLDGAGDGLPASLDAAAYGVVQEALTNALRHAAGSPVMINIRRTATCLDIEVTDEGPTGSPPPPLGPGGHGLLGMRERVSLLGGQLATGPRPGRPGWRVTASLPLQAGAA
jgi:signal transduction histidine kinase